MLSTSKANWPSLDEPARVWHPEDNSYSKRNGNNHNSRGNNNDDTRDNNRNDHHSNNDDENNNGNTNKRNDHNNNKQSNNQNTQHYFSESWSNNLFSTYLWVEEVKSSFDSINREKIIRWRHMQTTIRSHARNEAHTESRKHRSPYRELTFIAPGSRWKGTGTLSCFVAPICKVKKVLSVQALTRDQSHHARGNRARCAEREICQHKHWHATSPTTREMWSAYRAHELQVERVEHVELHRLHVQFRQVAARDSKVVKVVRKIWQYLRNSQRNVSKV